MVPIVKSFVLILNCSSLKCVECCEKKSTDGAGVHYFYLFHIECIVDADPGCVIVHGDILHNLLRCFFSPPNEHHFIVIFDHIMHHTYNIFEAIQMINTMSVSGLVFHQPFEASCGKIPITLSVHSIYASFSVYICF